MAPLPEFSSSLLRRCSSNQTLLSAFLRFFSATAVGGDTVLRDTPDCKAPSPEPHFMAEYLMSRCDFQPDKALKASMDLRRMKSPAQPDSVINFFKAHGFEDSQINKIVGQNPRYLRLSVDTRLAPKFQKLIDLGFSGDDLRQIVLSNASAIFNCNMERTVVPKIELWRKLLGSNEQLIKLLRRNTWLLSRHVEERVLPNIALMHEFGISDTALKNHPLLFVQQPTRLKALLDYVIELGIPLNSGGFLRALRVIQKTTVKGFKAKMQVMMSLGWSESEFICAFSKTPIFIALTSKVLQRKMDFFVKELGCDPSYVAKYPVLLTYGLEKRMKPRYLVMEILKSKGLHSDDYNLLTIMIISELKFREKYVLPYKEKVPELHELYVTSCVKDAISNSRS